MLRDFLTAFVVIGATLPLMSGVDRLQARSDQSATNQTATEQNPTNQSTALTPDPAAVTFATETGMVLHAVKPASVSDYEAAIVALQEAFAKSSDEDVRRVAAAWRVWKAAEPDAKSNVVFVHILQPTTADVDYRPSLWLDKLLAGAPPDLLAKYRDSFAVAPSMLSLTEFANMAVAPVTALNSTPAKPANSSPS